MNNRGMRTVAIYMVIVLLAMTFVRLGEPAEKQEITITEIANYTQLMQDVENDKIVKVSITTNDHTQTVEGELKDGQIIWDNDKLQNRMNIVTYKNPQCTICKFLPICWGPCCQKLLENPSQIERYCQLNKMEMSVEDFIKYRINNELIQQENEKD